MRVYIGWDPRDELAFRACVVSLRRYSSIPLDIYPLKDYDLRHLGIYHRPYHVEHNGQMIDSKELRPFSTQFSYTRFAVPFLEKGMEPVLFCDADMLWRRDIADLLALADDSKAIMCVQHDHRPPETRKMDGIVQAHYLRKNWSSLMLIRPELCTINKLTLNTASRLYLHGLLWQKEETIGNLPQCWNWLEGWSDGGIEPAVVHYTRGTPDMLGDQLPFAKEWWEAVAAWKPEMNHHGIKNYHPHWQAAAS